MDVAAKLPTMDDAALMMLHANAERLAQTGTAAQQSAAATLLPLITAERAARGAAKDSEAKAKALATKLAKAKAPTTKVAKKSTKGAVKAPGAAAEGMEANVR